MRRSCANSLERLDTEKAFVRLRPGMDLSPGVGDVDMIACLKHLAVGSLIINPKSVATECGGSGNPEPQSN